MAEPAPAFPCSMAMASVRIVELLTTTSPLTPSAALERWLGAKEPDACAASPWPAEMLEGDPAVGETVAGAVAGGCSASGSSKGWNARPRPIARNRTRVALASCPREASQKGDSGRRRRAIGKIKAAGEATAKTYARHRQRVSVSSVV